MEGGDVILGVCGCKIVKTKDEYSWGYGGVFNIYLLYKLLFIFVRTSNGICAILLCSVKQLTSTTTKNRITNQYY